MNSKDNIEEIIKKIYKGGAILFVGAGFSHDAIGFNGKLPISQELKKTICELMNTSYNDDKNLSQITDYFIGKYCKNHPEKLDEFIKLMKETFTVTEVQQYHTTIASLPWRRIYTTNYDNVIEEAAKKNTIPIDSKDLEDDVSVECCCVHINGKIEKLNKESLNKSFKLTSSSYISHETFYNTEWKKRFIDDIEIAQAIIFIGYSIYDIDIEKILFQNNQNIKNKVIFIEKENIDEMDKYNFEKYGKVYPIGARKFAELIEKHPPSDTKEETFFECFQEFRLIQDPDKEVKEQDVFNFLIYGKITDNLIQDETIRQRKKPPFLIPRSKIDDALEAIKDKKILVVVGDVGNGKTIFLKQLTTKLASTKRVFVLQNGKNEVAAKQDVDKIVKIDKESIVVIDSYVRHTKLLEHIELQQHKNLTIILAARTHEHLNYLKEKEYLKQAKLIEIDTLNDSELDYFYDIIEFFGMWYPSKNTQNKYSKSEKKRIMNEKCNKEISLILIHILESEKMKNKITKILENVFSENIDKKQVFAICLLNLMDIPISIGLLEEIIKDHDLSIYEDNNLKNIIDKNLIDKDNQISVKSPIFSLFVLKVYFSNEIIQYFLEILACINEKSSYDTKIISFIKKNLLRFRFVERLLPDDGKMDKLIQYYEKLKTEFTYLQEDPQYWLQYAMCFIMHNNLDTAQQKLSTAYEKAEKKVYEKTKIDNQQARLYLKKAAQHNKTNIEEAIDLFLKADKLLTRQKDDIYKYKIMIDYQDFIKNRSESFSEEQWNQIINCCEKQLKYLDKNIPKERFKEQRIYEECKNMLETIVLSIKNKPI